VGLTTVPDGKCNVMRLNTLNFLLSCQGLSTPNHKIGYAPGELHA
jgi:hypothetical protein